MKTVFADSSFYVALLISPDKLHAKAKQLAKSWTGLVVTTEYMLLEVANHVRGSKHRSRFGELLDRLRADPNTEVILSEPRFWQRGVELYRQRGDKHWSLTDFISFVVMEERGLAEALTADHHFEQAGFSVLLN